MHREIYHVVRMLYTYETDDDDNSSIGVWELCDVILSLFISFLTFTIMFNVQSSTVLISIQGKNAKQQLHEHT